jgi:catechol 2,3-dioxygenase-like lactoylglutathione lyase family enzyme
MLATSKVVAFLATTNAAAARDFYEFVLGLKFVSDDEFALVFEANGVELRVQKVRSLTPQTHTQLGWSVAEIEDLVRVLGAKGVAFERYSFLDQDVHNIWTAPSGARIAWLKDPDGNLLSLTEREPR